MVPEPVEGWFLSLSKDSMSYTHYFWDSPYIGKNMALYYDLPVFKDVYQMTLRIFQVTTNFTGDA